jgi:cysteine-rich repeat protein
MPRTFALAAVLIVTAAGFAAPACKSNQVNQTTNNQTNYMTIGPEGATLSGPEGTSLIVPAGALQENVKIGIGLAEPGDYVPPPQGVSFTGKVYAFLPHGQYFAIDPTIVMPAPAGEHEVWHAEDGEPWKSMPRVRSQGGVIRFKVSQFSFFAIGGYGPPDTTPRDPIPPPDGAAPGSGDAGGSSSCSECSTACKTACGSSPPDCLTTCMQRDCPQCAGDPGTSTDSGTCQRECPVTGENGAACTSCGGPYPCSVDSPEGVTQDCVCEPRASGDLAGTLVNCKSAGGSSGPPVCGNGKLETGEGCDDGNVLPGDGCDRRCVVESGFTCPVPGQACKPL